MLLNDTAFPAAWRKDARSVARAIIDCDRFIVSAHERPDGDGVGCLAAAGYLLRALGKEFILYSSTGLPAYLGFLEMPATVHTNLGHLPFTPETILALDCGTPSRLGDELASMAGNLACINIDHHPGSGMGTVAQIIRTDAASATQVLALVCEECGITFSKELSQALALGLVTDTGGFRHENTSPSIFALAALLMQRGADIYDIRENLDKNWSLARLNLWGHLSGRISMHADNRIAFCPLYLKDFRETCTGVEDAEGFVERMREIRSVLISALLREVSPGICKFSLRASGDADVSAVASILGGGGHMKAAGGTLRMPMAEATETLLAALREACDKV